MALAAVITISGERNSLKLVVNGVGYTQLFSGHASTDDGTHPIVKWNWSFGGNAGDADAQTDEGKIVAHRYDVAGTFTVTLTVTDSAGNTAQTTTLTDPQGGTTASIVISNFSGTEYYISDSGGNDTTGLGTQLAPWKTIQKAIDVANGLSQLGVRDTPVRIRLKRGDTFSLSADQQVPRPGIIDDYGAGAKPIISFTLNSIALVANVGGGGVPDPGNTGVIQDLTTYWGWGVRVQNITLTYATPRDKGDHLFLLPIGSSAKGCTLTNGGIHTTDGGCIEDCAITNAENIGSFADGGFDVMRRTTISGCGSSATLDHQAYWVLSGEVDGFGRRSVALFEDCVFDGAGGTDNSGYKICGLVHVRVNRCIAKNSLNGFEPGQNPEQSAGMSNDIIIENSAAFSCGTGVIADWVDNLVVRNCFFYNNSSDGFGNFANFPGGGYRTAITWYLYNNSYYNNVGRDVALYGASVVPPHIVLRNNIFHKAAVADSHAAFIYIHNAAGFDPSLVDSDYNLFYWSGTTVNTLTIIIEDGGSVPTTSINTWRTTHGKDTHSLPTGTGTTALVDPLYNDTASADFTIKSTSTAKDAGTAIATVWRDKKGTARPQNSIYDIGADEIAAGDTTPPTVSIDSPSNGATVSGTVTISATASDDVGVVGVQFKVDGANQGAEDLSAPYSISWDTTGVANGSHALTAVARDAAGNSTTSSTVNVTVNNVAPAAPRPGAVLALDPGLRLRQLKSPVRVGVRPDQRTSRTWPPRV